MPFKLKLTFTEEKAPLLLDISSLLYDFELLHDLTLLLYADDYSGYHFSNFFWYRNGRRIKPEHRVRATKIVKESPLVIVVDVADVLAISGALWALIQAIDKIQKWRLDKKKLTLELKNLDLQNRKLELELEDTLEKRKAAQILSALVKRLGDNPIILEDLEIQVEKNSDEKVSFT